MIRVSSGEIMRGISVYLPVSLHARAMKLGVNMTQSARDGILRVVEAEEARQKNEAADGGATTTTKSLPRRPVSQH